MLINDTNHVFGFLEPVDTIERIIIIIILEKLRMKMSMLLNYYH